jgi:hypothetical protein
MAPVITIRVNGCIIALYKSELLNAPTGPISESFSYSTGAV